ncbi:TetR family transcriptional regulator C-terminal domain-containing protein [Jeotgalibacillus sp. ET6]|uniref:TetR/AcrR family transcriptional regulator n=1 Tax=Jeotgalibacillus sp. ET6 TaxID=3037260 RepID=UPI002418AE7F|nr:TetR family transcriptional regulator C-terminal domain-containing protein [Jeotgalibacillus sp. ET6]MDG5471329.1 TetR family transcriptional regulator C-terminal domain-containing protein [Jeotgalibacillus sp. ET6]
MPKKVDHTQRKKQIAEAAFQVILNDGIEGASARRIAAQAGLSLGALRHYFQTQDELLHFAMEEVKAGVGERMQAIINQPIPLLDKTVALLLELIPLNDQSKVEMEVWLAFTAYARHKPGFTLHDDQIYAVILHLLHHLDESKLLKDGIDKELETEKLYALTDGIALHALLDPSRLNLDMIQKVIRSQIQGICHPNT